MFEGLKRRLAEAFLADQEHGQKALTKARLEACGACKLYNRETKQCTKCGCYMDIKAKLSTNRNPFNLGRIEVTHCPIGAWPGIDVTVEGKKVSIVPVGGTDYRLAEYYKN